MVRGGSRGVPLKPNDCLRPTADVPPIDLLMRVLKPGPRAAIAFGTLFGLFLVVAAFAYRPGANLIEGLKGVLVLAGGFAALLIHIYLARVTVGDDYIEYRAGLARSTRLAFSDIGHSATRVLAEPSHPLFLDIFRAGSEHHHNAPALRIRLKPFQTADVKWLLSLPQLKIRPR